MKAQHLVVVLLALLLAAACTPQPETAVAPQDQTAPVVVQETTLPPDETARPTESLLSTAMATAQVETAGPDCLGDEISPLGKSIAEEYDFSSYEQVMTWFCNGAEYEDILVALETQSQTGTPADEMLKMLAGGSSWDEIWQQIGLTD